MLHCPLKSFGDKHFYTLYNMLSTTTLRASAPAILATKYLLLAPGTRVACCGLVHGVQTRKFTGSANSFFLATTPKANQERPLKAFRERSFPHPVYTEEQMNDIVSFMSLLWQKDNSYDVMKTDKLLENRPPQGKDLGRLGRSRRC